MKIKGKKPDYIILFNDLEDSCKKVGKLYLQDGKLHFDGDIDQSAKSFFEAFKNMVDDYIEKELKQ